MKKNIVKIPVIPVRNEVIFPGTESLINIARPKSINALIASQQQNQEYVIVVAQKIDSAELVDPNINQLYTFGTLCKIKTIHNLGNSLRYQVSFIGVSRFKIENFESMDEGGNSYLSCNGVIEQESNHSTEQIPLIINSLYKSFQEYTNINDLENVSFLLNSIKKEMSAVVISNLISSSISLSLNDKQKILEELNLEDRLNFILQKILSDINSKKVKSAIHKRTLDQINKSQKELFLKEQMKAIQAELGQDTNSVKNELLSKINSIKMPNDVRKIAEEEARKIESVHPSSSDYNVIKNYLEWILNIPWNKQTKDKIDLLEAKTILDQDHFGLENPKKRILEYLAVAKIKNSLKAPIICLAGPPGVGKTSLGKSIARTLGRKFSRIALGGVRDEAEIRGHRRTYVGAMPGKIIQTLKKLEVNNPVILLDEIDKMGKGVQGDPAAAMLEVLDPEQNSNFLDHYLDIGVDLSKILFICTANVLEEIPSPLRDRMEIIYVDSYSLTEKKHIAKNYLFPKMLIEHGLNTNNVIFNDEIINMLISNYTRESGVRELQRVIATICRSCVKKIVETGEKQINLIPELIEDFLGIKKYGYETVKKIPAGVATGLAWTAFGGDILSIEASKMEGNGSVILTGSLGDVMKESATIALSVIKTHKTKFNINENFNNIDIHIHLPSGSTPKDGPSAGITLVSTIVSLLINKPLKEKLAMTGEISLKGQVLPVGGIKEKIIAAQRSGITEVIIPLSNKNNVKEIPEEILKNIKINYVEDIFEVLKISLDI